MMIQEAIDKANEGGYHMHGSDGMETSYDGANNEFSGWTRKDNLSTFLVPTEETFLDPRFWQALGCALGWSEVCDLTIIWCMARKSVSVVVGTTGCTNGIVLFRYLRTGTRLKPSLRVSPLLSNVSLVGWD